MKSFALVFSLLVSATSLASIVPTKNVTVNTNFEFTTSKGPIKSSGSMIIDPTKTQWTTMVPPKEGVALLGRIAKLSGNIATMEFMVVDTNQTEAMKSNARLVMKMGQPAEIAQGAAGEAPALKIGVTVEKTR